MIKDYDNLFKIVIIGNSGVGKSSLLLRFSDDQFNENYLATIGVDFRFKTLFIDGKKIKLQIWDTAGQEKFRTITSAYYKGADGIVIVYDVTSQNSFDDVDKFWMSEIDSYVEKETNILLIGNKSDLQKQVNSQSAQEYAEKQGMVFFEVSAKTNNAVHQAFLTLTREIMNKKIYMKIGLCAALLYPQLFSKLEVYNKQTSFNQRIIEKCQEIQKGYYLPTLYLGYGYLQIFFCSKSQYIHNQLTYKREYIDLGDYGELGIDIPQLVDESQINEEKAQKNQKNILVILLGSTASRDEPYIVNITSEALKEGYKVVLYNDRLYNNYEEKGRIFPKEGYYCMVKDIDNVMNELKKKYYDYNFYAVGHSFGANMLVKYLGQYKESSPFKGAVSVANPFDIKKANSKISKYFDNYLVECRKQILQMRIKLLQNPPMHLNIDVNKALKAQTSMEFDELFSTKLQGVPTVSDYYHNISCINDLKDIQIPLLCINSKDDPILHHSTIPYEEAKSNENIILLVTKTGGHVGWFEGFFKPKRWYIKPALEFINAISEAQNN